MNLPHLPTDNLYKFIAITGLLLIAAGWLLPNFFINETNLLKIEREAKIKEIQRTIEFLKKNLPADNREKFLQEYSDVILKGKQETAHLSKLEDLEKYLSARNDYIVKWSNRLLLIGLVITPLGFILWYFKLQRYQDRIVKKEAERNSQS